MLHVSESGDGKIVKPRIYKIAQIGPFTISRWVADFRGCDVGGTHEAMCAWTFSDWKGAMICALHTGMILAGMSNPEAIVKQETVSNPLV